MPFYTCAMNPVVRATPLLLLASLGHAAESSAPAADRAALLPTEQRMQTEQGEAFPDDEVVWLTVGDGKVLGVFRKSVGPPLPRAFLLVLPAGYSADGDSATATLRHVLPRRGYATFTVALPLPATPDPTPAQIRARLDAALIALRARAPEADVIVLGEHQAAAWVVWAQNQGMGAAAAVVLNFELDAPSIADVEPADLVQALAGPALVLIESPHPWSLDIALSDDAELQLLPPGHAGGERIERRLRGWIKRRFADNG